MFNTVPSNDDMALLCCEEGVKFLYFLLSKADKLNGPIKSNICDWTFCDLARLSKSEQTKWKHACQEQLEALSVVEHGVYPVFYSVFPIFLPILLSPPEVFLAFAQSKRPSQRLTMCALLSFFLTPIRRPSISVVHRLL
jgi:hypothetical protein